ncbi:D-galactose-binding periplasmic protein precursor [Clostridium beijerinckii]|nr:D-galactose-binding periplasmic protein precursor [Clostridium beijerinckii]
MDSYDKVWYVGAHAEQSGTLSGQLIADYFKAHPEADKNHDGVVQYVMLQGEPGHQDATLRTEYSIKAIEAAGLKTQKLAADTAMWDKAKATDLMKAFMTGQGVDKIEAVLCNNDDMALGAVEALKAEGYNKGDASKYIPVVGVDATAPALQAMKEGSLLGTVLNDAQNQGKATVNIALAAAQGKEINKENVGFDVTDGKYVWIDYVKVTQDNYKDYLK